MNPNPSQSRSGVSVSASVPERASVLDHAGFFHTQFLKWPQEIPRSQRVKVNTGHRSFCFHREYVGAEALNRRAIQLKGNLVITVFSGSLLIERGAERHLVEAGGMAMVQEGELDLTEIPVSGQSYGEIYYFFFPTEVLRDWSRRNPGAERIALGLRPWPFEIGVTPRGVTNFLPVMRLAGSAFPHNFAKVLTVSINQMSAAMYGFLAKTYYLPRLRLNLLMEQHIFSDHRGLGEIYSGGAKQIAEEFRVFQGVSVEGWMRKRRMQLSREWMTHHVTGAKELAQKFHYKEEKDFERDFRKECRPHSASIITGSTGEEMDLAKPRINAPFWLPTALKLAPVDEHAESKAHSAASEKAEADFWTATSTIAAVCNVIKVRFGHDSNASTLGDAFLLEHAA